MPADLVGTRVYRPDTGRFDTELGPVFGNFLLADEINRAPAKVQSALLEVMQERQVTIGGTSYPVPLPFLVMATQNPIEHEGTYPLPEAQLDRFLIKVFVDYPEAEDERKIYRLMTGATPPDPQSLAEVAKASGGKTFTAGDTNKLSDVYKSLGSLLGTKNEKRQVTAGFAGGALVLLLLGAAMSLRWFGRLI